MKINRIEIRFLLEELAEREIEEKGMQPELSLGCFMSLMRQDNKYCEKCEHYEKVCRRYLECFKIEEELFGR